MWWYESLRPAIRAGYQPLRRELAAPVWVRAVPDGPPGRVLAFCPTVLLSENQGSQRETIAELARQLELLPVNVFPARPVLLIGLQYTPGDHEAARHRVEALLATGEAAGVATSAFLQCGFGKVRQVNIALHAALEASAEALLQVDDDIWLEPGCVEALILAFRCQGGRGVVGAAKRGMPRQQKTSRLLIWLKRKTRPAVNYPHACCMAVQPRDVASGIPPRYVSDDGFLCFHFLRPSDDDPFRLLRLAEGARCAHFVGGPAGRSFARIQRLLRNHHVYLADFPTEVSRFYLRRILFPGFWPVGAREGFHPLRWLLQSLYFAWFVIAGLELAIRGITGTPLRQIPWAGFDERVAPREGTRVHLAREDP